MDTQTKNANQTQEIIKSVGTGVGLLVLTFLHVFLYYQNIDSVRLISGRLIYAATPLTIFLMILFTIQYSILFMNFLNMISVLKNKEEDRLYPLYATMIKNIGLFLVFSFISEILVVRLG